MKGAPSTTRADYDVVVVGGGHNGLVAASYLARAGRSCLVLERRAELGGAAVSKQVFRGFDAHLSRYSYLVSLLPKRIVEELSLPVRLAPRAVSSYSPDPRRPGRAGLLVDAQDAGATRSSFREVTGGESDYRAWESFYAMTRRIAAAVFPTLLEPLRSREQMRALIHDDAAWEVVFERPLGEALTEYFADDLVRGVVLTDALIGTFAAAGDAALRQNRCLLYHVIGRGTGDWDVPIGGMGAISQALVQAAQGAGAELRTRTEVTRVEPDAGGVDVRLGDGVSERWIRAGLVLVNAAPAELERLLGFSDSVRPEGAQLKVNLLLSRLPRLLDPGIVAERAFAGTFHVNETASQLQRAHDEALGGSIPSPAPCECYCHSLTDPAILGPELRRSGAHTLTVFGLQMPARLFASDPSAARAVALESTLASLNSVLGEPIEDCLMRGADGEPCLEAHSPLDLEAELRMPGGHIFHRDLEWPFAEREEEVGEWGVESGHPRILICGAGARRGGGVSGVPGRNAAMAALAAAGAGAHAAAW